VKLVVLVVLPAGGEGPCR